jgi:protein SCO1/2
MKLRAAFLATVMLAAPAGALARTASEVDAADYAFEQRPGAVVPAAAVFTQADGRPVRFGDILGRRPVVLALGYFHCPTLCSVVRDDLFEALSHAGLAAGADYELAVASIDPSETPADAAAAAADDAARYPAAAGGAAAPTGWHFLVGDTAALAAAVGFRSRYDVHLKQFLHPAGLVVLTPEGRVSGYVLGAGYHAGDLAAALATASTGGIAKAALPVLLLCFHFDPATGRYSFAVMKALRLAGLVTVLVLGGTLFLLFRGESRKRA